MLVNQKASALTTSVAAMFSRISIFSDVTGIADRKNTIAYLPPKRLDTSSTPPQVGGTKPLINPSAEAIEEREKFEGHVIFFPGDIQDFSDEMRKHHSCSNFVEWNYEMTLNFISRKFPRGHVWLVRPAKKAYSSICIYKNFVKSESLMGVPSHSINYDGLNHLEGLITSALVKVPVDSLETAPIILMGFSKGCIVLNQFLYEMSILGENLPQEVLPPNEEHFAKPSIDFVRRIKCMLWLDGGHSGEEDVWVTNPDIITSLSLIPQCRSIKFRIHVTPYQVHDLHRPWKGEAEKEFVRLLQESKLDVEEKFHFEDKEATIDTHFNILIDF